MAKVVHFRCFPPVLSGSSVVFRPPEPERAEGAFAAEDDVGRPAVGFWGAWAVGMTGVGFAWSGL
jgi:hypothetical protein